MKTKVEIIEDITGFDQSEQLESGWVVDFPDVYEAMDIYAAQEVDRAKGETCKWKRTTPKPGSGWLAGCDKEDGFPFSNMLVMDYFKYCPFCGKKIERV